MPTNYDRARAIGEELAESDAQTEATNAALRDYVYVARSIDPWSDGEPYVFDTEEHAEEFVSTRGDDWCISAEPILGADFVKEAREED